MNDRYALLFGGTVFADGSPSLNGDRDVAIWKDLFIENHCYLERNIFTLIGQEFTLRNVIMSVFGIAAKMKATDQLTVVFCTHGAVENDKNQSKNFLLTYDTYLTDRVLLFLLKLFKPHTRIAVVVDACESGTLIESNDVDPLDQDDLNFLEKTLENENPILKDLFLRVLHEQQNIALTAEVTYIASSTDLMSAVDSIFVSCAKIFYQNVISKNEPMGNYSRFIYRMKIYFSELFYPERFGHHCKSVESLLDKYQGFRNLLANSSIQITAPHKNLYEFMQPDLNYEKFLLQVGLYVKREELEFMSESDRRLLSNTLESFRTIRNYKNFQIPVLRYYGMRDDVKSAVKTIFEP